MQIKSTQDISERLEFLHNWQMSSYGEDGNSLMNRLREAEAYLAESGKILADAKYHHSNQLESKIIGAIKEGFTGKLPANAVNKLINSYCSDEKILVDLADRVNATFVHQIDSIRTQISYIKALATIR